MKHLHHIPNESAMDTYRMTLTGERLGWAVCRTLNSFRPAHRVEMDPEVGPVIIVCDDVYEVDPEADAVYLTEEEARDAFWEGLHEGPKT